MNQIKEMESNLDSVQDCETPKFTPKKNDPEAKNSMNVCNQMNMKESDQQEFVSEAFNILTKLCDLKIEEKANESGTTSAELPKFLYRDISNRKQKLLLEAEYEFLIINACDILSRLLDQSPGCARLKYSNKHSPKTKHMTLNNRQLKEFYKDEECISIDRFNGIMHRECKNFKTLDLKSFDVQSSNDRESNLYDSNIIKDWEDWNLPLVNDAVSITIIYDSIETDSIADSHLITKAQFLLEQENMVRDSLFIENELAIDKESIADSIDKILERKKYNSIGKLDKSGSEYDDFFKPCTIIENISPFVTSQDIQSKIPYDNVDSSINSKNCIRKTGTRRTNRNISTSDSKTNQIENSMGKVVTQPILPDKKSLFNQLNKIDLSKVTAFKESILQYIPKKDDYFKSSKEFENSLRGIGNTLGLGKWWQEEFAKLQKEGIYFSSETQEELKSIEKFMNTSFKEILKPVCDKQQNKMSAQLPMPTRNPKKVFSNMEKKLASHKENDRKRSPLRTKMNTNLMKRSNDKKILTEKIIANDKKGENVKNAKLASMPIIKKAKVLKNKRYSAKFKTINKLPNGKHSALRNKAKFIQVKTQFKTCTPFKILRTPVNNYSKATSKNQRVLLKNKPVPCKNRISLKNQSTPLKNSRKIFKKSRTPFKNQQIAFKKSFSAKNLILKETIN